MKKIGITNTVPVEVLKAAGYQPVDLNNVLVTDPNPEWLVNIAEKHGFPLNCAQIKAFLGMLERSQPFRGDLKYSQPALG
jgi:benzoyl-CoA reductase/2-hydroxyglutaryl-CoA dehydratase subunit BcrC/BadD/HgdB